MAATKMAFCKKYLDFEPTENPKWRMRLKQNERLIKPTISKMISEILTYRENYSLALSKNEIVSQKRDEADKELLIKFLLNIQEEEKNGMRDAEKTEKIIDVINASELEEKGRGSKRHASIDNESNKDLVDSEDNAKRRRRVSNDVASNLKQIKLPCYPSPGSIEEEIVSTYKSTCKTSTPPKSIEETKNLYRGYKYIAKEVQQMLDGKSGCQLLMEVKCHVLETHKILMDNISKNQSTEPGRFSTSERHTSFDGVNHVYPQFATEQVAEAAVIYIVDVYNEMIYEIDGIPDSEGTIENKLKLSFKCASLFLFGFLALHPFGDGNGRLARLLCSYSLLTVSPFLTPIYNVFSSTVENDYIEALVAARKDMKISEMIKTENDGLEAAESVLNQKPEDLCALIIESNWSMWREYLNLLGIDKGNP